jgi:hypothetical protein
LAAHGAAAGRPCWTGPAHGGRSGNMTGRAGIAPHAAAGSAAGRSGTAAGRSAAGRFGATQPQAAAGLSCRAPHGPSSGRADLPAGIRMGAIAASHGPFGAGAPIGLRTTTDSDVTGPCSVMVSGYGIFAGSTAPGSEPSACDFPGAAARRSDDGPLCQETWTGLAIALPAWTLGTTSAVIVPRLVSPCGSTPIRQIS